MTLKNFLKFVEIQTKVASIIPFLIGTLYAVFRFKNFHFVNFVIMFMSLISFDMTTTAINNYIDYKKSKREDKGAHNSFVSDGIKEPQGILIIFILLGVAIGFGIMLTLKTNYLVLLIGILSFIAGILYTFGPIPISRMPLGEIFSGFFMGFIIMFLSIYIQIYDKNTIVLLYTGGVISFSMNLKEIIYILLVAIPQICGIANIMLANNICDLDEDIKNKRFTLPYYLGEINALKLFKSLYYIGYLDIIIMVILGVAPLAILLVLLTFIPVSKAIKVFCKEQVKEKTFKLSVKIFILMNGSQLIFLTGVVIFRQLFR